MIVGFKFILSTFFIVEIPHQLTYIQVKSDLVGVKPMTS